MLNDYADIDESQYDQPEMTLSESLNYYIATGKGLLDLVGGIISQSTGLTTDEAYNLEAFVQGRGNAAIAFETGKKLLNMDIPSGEVGMGRRILWEFINSSL